MSQFKKYLEIVTESKNYFNSKENNDIEDLIQKLNDDDIENLKSLKSFDRLNESEDLKLKKIITDIVHANKGEFSEGNFESLKEFILNKKNIKRG
jgi:hypothetical protein